MSGAKYAAFTLSAASSDFRSTVEMLRSNRMFPLDFAREQSLSGLENPRFRQNAKRARHRNRRR
jgi:hypothetical protein